MTFLPSHTCTRAHVWLGKTFEAIEKDAAGHAGATQRAGHTHTHTPCPHTPCPPHGSRSGEGERPRIYPLFSGSLFSGRVVRR